MVADAAILSERFAPNLPVAKYESWCARFDTTGRPLPAFPLTVKDAPCGGDARLGSLRRRKIKRREPSL
ncbi:MAG: hypothetical protein JWN43_3700 [Gammaproteobacteria bacterium]|nr:hypothetical protein [Gammaproteobacteria bacterium]